MIRGTTPTHVFAKLPVLSTDVDEVWVSYFQNGREILTKDKTAAEFIDDTAEDTSILEVHLTQEDTLLFKYGPASVQLRILLMDGTALASDEVPLTVKRIIKDGVIE